MTDLRDLKERITKLTKELANNQQTGYELALFKGHFRSSYENFYIPGWSTLMMLSTYENITTDKDRARRAFGLTLLQDEEFVKDMQLSLHLELLREMREEERAYRK